MQNNYNNSENLHESPDILRHEQIQKQIKGVKPYEDPDAVLDIVGGAKQTQPKETINTQNFPKISQNQAQLRHNSTSGHSTSNKRQKTTTTKTWYKTAIAIIIASSLYTAGLISSDAVETKWSTIKKASELKKDTKAYQQMIDEAFTTKTYTGDKKIDSSELAQKLEQDGVIDNKELYMTVATLGEVKANEVLAASSNPPADSIESYMRGNNITDINDWKNKTIQSLVAEGNLSEAQAELDSIFKNATPTANTNENQITTEGTYGGK